jgi:hypothetical protein
MPEQPGCLVAAGFAHGAELPHGSQFVGTGTPQVPELPLASGQHPPASGVPVVAHRVFFPQSQDVPGEVQSPVYHDGNLYFDLQIFLNRSLKGLDNAPPSKKSRHTMGRMPPSARVICDSSSPSSAAHPISAPNRPELTIALSSRLRATFDSVHPIGISALLQFTKRISRMVGGGRNAVLHSALPLAPLAPFVQGSAFGPE